MSDARLLKGLIKNFSENVMLCRDKPQMSGYVALSWRFILKSVVLLHHARGGGRLHRSLQQEAS